MNSVQEHLLSQQPPSNMSAMAKKLAGIRHFRDGAEVQEIVDARIEVLQSRLDAQAKVLAGALQEKRQQVKQIIATTCDEVDALNPCDVVKERLAEGTQTVQRAKDAQQALLLAMQQGEEKLQRELQERMRLETMLQEYRRPIEAYNPNAKYEQGLVNAGKSACYNIANIQEPQKRPS